jgi:hypothetical protein
MRRFSSFNHYTTVPSNFPIPAVKAIANAPQNVTRDCALDVFNKTTYAERMEAVKKATGWSSDEEFPWLETDEMEMLFLEQILLSELQIGSTPR